MDFDCVHVNAGTQGNQIFLELKSQSVISGCGNKILVLWKGSAPSHLSSRKLYFYKDTVSRKLTHNPRQVP